MPTSKSKKTKHDIEEGYALDSEHISRKKTAKSRKRELENMYASEPLQTFSPMGYKTKMTSHSLPTNLDVASPEHKGKGKRRHKQSSRAKRGADSPPSSPRGEMFQESEQSMWIDDLEQPRRVVPSPVPPKNNAGNTKIKRELSKQFSFDRSIHDTLRSSPIHQNSPQRRGRGNDTTNGGSSQRGRTEPLQRGRSQSLQRGRSQSLQRGRSQSLDRSNSSRPPMARGRSSGGNSIMLESQHQHSMHRSGQHPRSHSLDASNTRGRSLDRSGSSPPRRGSRPTLSSHLSRSRSVSRSRSMSRSTSGSGSILLDGNASVVASIATINGQKTLVLTTPAQVGVPAKRGRRGIRRFIPKEVEERPPRSLVVIWSIVAVELGFDLATTIIAFNSFLAEDTCCGNPIDVGPIPLGSTVPFFLLVVTELAVLIRAIVLTLWPSMMAFDDDAGSDGPNEKQPPRSCVRRYLCCFLRFKVRVLMQIVNFMVLLNPFFGCIIAWILMYQSNEKDAFIVLGMEGASLILHFVSVWLEGCLKTCKQIAFHSIPVIPFAVSVGLVLYYLKQGGVCYLVDEKLFMFTGCEICNITGVLQPCPNSTKFFNDFTSNLDSFDDVKNTIMARSFQSSYCAITPEERSFCFYDYDGGQVEPVNQANWTASISSMPSELPLDEVITSAPEAAPEEEDVPTGSEVVVTTPPVSPTLPPGESTVPPVGPETPTRAPVAPTLPPLEPSEPPVDSTEEPPTRPPVTPTPPSTEQPTSTPETNAPAPDPVSEPTADDSGSGGGGGSDGFDMDEVGSDSFNPDDVFGE
jgi:hypothetical protein